MSFIVTGAAGFIGANIVKGLNNRGCNDVIAVDNLTQADKFVNLADHHIIDYFDKVEMCIRDRHWKRHSRDLVWTSARKQQAS